MTAKPAPAVYRYAGRLVRVVDGDTLYLRVTAPCDFGFRRMQELSSVEEFRLEGIDTPERKAPTRAMGDLVAQVLDARLRFESGGPRPLDVKSLTEDDKYGRWLARVSVLGIDEPDVGLWLIDHGYARAYDGRGKRAPWDPALPYPLPLELRGA